MKLVQQVCHASSEMGKRNLCSFHQNVGQLSLFSKAYFSAFKCCAVWLRHHQIFAKICGNFPISPKIGGAGKESNHGILKLHHTLNCSKHTHEPSIRWFRNLKANKKRKNKDISNRGKI